MRQRLTGPALVKYLRDNPASDAGRWAADELEAQAGEIQDQARLLGISAERELRLMAERDALRSALEKLLAGARAETAESWQCNSYHPKLIAGMDVAATALAQGQEGTDEQ